MYIWYWVVSSWSCGGVNGVKEVVGYSLGEETGELNEVKGTDGEETDGEETDEE